MFPYDDIYERGMQRFGELLGDVYNILRPDYTIADNTPETIAYNVAYRCDPSTPVYAEPKFTNVDFFSIFGDRDILQSGDMFEKATPDGMSSIITMSHFGPIKEMVGFRTTRIGKLCDTLDEIIYSPVYFDFLGTGYLATTLNRKIEDSTRIPSTRAIIYKRENIFRLRTQLIETDSSVMITNADGDIVPYQRKWLIEEIDQSGNLMILNLSNNLSA
jgi:hypothetical protein